METIKLADGRECRVHFRHQYNTGQYNGAPEKQHSVQVVTICSLSLPDFIALGAALCVRTDQFSRAIGRQRAFEKALENVGKEDVVTPLQAWFQNKWPTRVKRARQKLSAEEKQRRVDSGAEIRAQRAANKGETTGGAGA
jgi:hypothetical protein